jgi:hypothetical protein
MTAGFVLFVVAHVLPIILSPGTPPAVLTLSKLLPFIAIPSFVAGACIYSGSKGYPFWLGIFSVSLVGLVILLLLPDHDSAACQNS